MIPIFSNSLGKEELVELKRIFESKWIGPGKEGELFEKELGEILGTPRVLVTNSCTAGLFMSMKILGIGKGDEVIIPTVHFIGAVNAIIDCGATPVFADVDVNYLNILPSEILRLRNHRTKAVMLLNYGGHVCDMPAIWEAAKGLHIIGDNAASPFSSYKGMNCNLLGDIGIVSFDAMKVLCMGSGGAIILKNDELYNKAKEFRYFGLPSKNKSGIDSLKDGKNRWWEIELSEVSNRYIQSDILTAIGRVQLRKLPGFLKRRKEVWQIYQEIFSDLDWLEIPPEPLPNTETSYYFYWVKVEHRDKLAQYLIDNGIYCTFRYYPLHLIKKYNSKAILPNAEFLSEHILNIPIHQNLSDEDLDKIITTIRDFKC